MFTPVSNYENNRFSEYLVPALHFPVANASDSNPMIPRVVVIPIVEGFGSVGIPVDIMKTETSGGSTQGSVGAPGAPTPVMVPDVPVQDVKVNQ